MTAPRVLFIVTTGRAGSVLMQSLFDSHPDAIGFPGLSPLYFALFDRSTFADADALIEHLTLFSPARKLLLGLPDLALGDAPDTPPSRRLPPSFAGFLREELPAAGAIDRRTAVLALHRAHARCRGRDPDRARLIVEHLHLPSALSQGLADFPEAYCINMLRDPRSGFYSLHQAILRWFDHGKTRGFHGFTERCWLAGWQLFAEGHPSLPVERLKHVRLEDLHRDGETVMRELAAWLEIDFHESLLQSTIDGVAWSGLTAAGTPASGLSPARGDEVAHDPLAAARIEWVLGELMERAGYHRQAPNGAAGRALGLLSQLLPLERELWVAPWRALSSSVFDDAVETPLVEWLQARTGQSAGSRALWSTLGLEREGSASRAALRGLLIATLTAVRVGVDPWLFYAKRPWLFARARRRLQARPHRRYTAETLPLVGTAQPGAYTRRQDPHP